MAAAPRPRKGKIHSVIVQSECESVWPPAEPVVEVTRGADGCVSLTVATYEEDATSSRLVGQRHISVRWADLERAYRLTKEHGA